MPFCPQCNAEYREGITACAECQVELAPQPSPEETVEYVEWKVLQPVPNELVGNMLKGILQGAGIDVILRSDAIAVYGGIKNSWTSPDWGKLLVHRDDFAEARDVVEEYLASLPINRLENPNADIETV